MQETPARDSARAGCLSWRTTMTTNATREQEPDASSAETEVEPAWPCPNCASADYN
jgi:hypothetical protein